jgi:TonB family protein
MKRLDKLKLVQMNTFRFFITGIGIFLCTILFLSEKMYANPKNSNPVERRLIEADTTVYNGEVDSTAELIDVNYLRNNNKFKDWDKNKKTHVTIQGVVEKNGTITNVKILRSSNGLITNSGMVRSSEDKQLDDEALRLVKSAKYRPATLKNEDVRSLFTTVVDFPAK